LKLENNLTDGVVVINSKREKIIIGVFKLQRQYPIGGPPTRGTRAKSQWRGQ